MKTITITIADDVADALEAGARCIGLPNAAAILESQANQWAPHYASQARERLRNAGLSDDGPLLPAIEALLAPAPSDPPVAPAE